MNEDYTQGEPQQEVAVSLHPTRDASVYLVERLEYFILFHRHTP